MAYFNILRNRHNKLIGFNVDGFTVKSWEELQRLAESRIAKHDPSWEEIEITGQELEAEAVKISLDLSSELAQENERLASQNLELLGQSNLLLASNSQLTKEIESLREKARNRITSMKSGVKQEIKAVQLILKAIQDGQSSHWQKKENIRLALEILATIPTFDRHEFFSYEDDF